VAEPSAASWCLQSLLIRGGGALDIHMSLVAGGGHSPTPAVVKDGGLAPKRAGERVAAVEAAGRSGVAPESAGSKCVVPEQGSLDRPVQKARVRFKM
jgi:hypothetical protein